MRKSNSYVIQLFIGFLLIFGLSSCNKNNVYNKLIGFENYKWSKNKTVVFEPTITSEHINKPLKLEFTINYIHGFPFKFLHLKVLITNPKGETKYQDISIQIIADNGKYNGDGAGDYWDLKHIVDEMLVFENEGKYKIEIKPNMEVDPINFMDQIELRIEKQEKESK